MQWYIVFVMFLTYVAGQIDRNIMAMLVQDMKRDLGFSDEQLGVLMGFGFSLTYATSAIFVGFLADRTNRKRLLMIGIAAWSALTLICGVIKSFPGLMLARLGVGAGESVLAPTALPMVAGAFPPDRRALPVSLTVSGSAIGHIVTPVFIGLIVHATAGYRFGPFPVVGTIFGWQLSFFVAGSLGAVILIMLSFVRENSGGRGERKHLTGREVAGHFLEYKAFYAAILFSVPLFTAANYGLYSWMPAYLERTFQLRPAEIGFWVGGAFIPSAVISPFIAGYLGRFSARSSDPRLHFRILAGVIVLGALSIVAPMLLPTVPLAIAALALAVAITNVAITFGMVNVQQAVPEEHRSQATAILMAALILLGSGLGPMIVGTLATRILGEDQLGLALCGTVILTTPVALLLIAFGYSRAAPRTTQ